MTKPFRAFFYIAQFSQQFDAQIHQNTLHFTGQREKKNEKADQRFDLRLFTVSSSVSLFDDVAASTWDEKEEHERTYLQVSVRYNRRRNRKKMLYVSWLL